MLRTKYIGNIKKTGNVTFVGNSGYMVTECIDE